MAEGVEKEMSGVASAMEAARARAAAAAVTVILSMADEGGWVSNWLGEKKAL